MEITQGNLSAVFRGFDARFKRALALQVASGANRLMQKAEGVSKTEDYPMSGLLGDLYELVDEVYANDIWQMTQRARATVYAGSLPIRKQDIQDDRIGLYQGPIDDLALQASSHMARNIAPTLMNGFTDTWGPDGETIFSNGHEWPGGQTWDNYVNLALNADNFDTACQQLEEMPNPNGEPMGLSPKLLVCGPSNRAAAEEIVQVRTLANGAENRQYQRADLLVLPRITDDSWYVADDNPYNVDLESEENREILPDVQLPKPLLADIRQDVETTSQTSADADSVFDRNEYRYKAELRYALLIIAPWMIIGSDGGS